MGLSETVYSSNTSSRNAKEFLKCVGEELDRATEVLNNLKTRGERTIPNDSTSSPYEFLRKLDKEALFTSNRQHTATATATANRENNKLQVIALPSWWNETAALALPLPTDSPILLLEQSECTSTSSNLDQNDNNNFQSESECSSCWCLGGVRLLKIDSHGHRLTDKQQKRCFKLNRLENGTSNSYKETDSTRLLHCPKAVLQQDSSSSFLSLPAPTLPAPLVAVPPGDLAAVVNKLRQMTTSVAELQEKLTKALENKKIMQQQKIQQHTQKKDQKGFNIKLTRF